VILVENLDTGSLQNIAHLRDENFVYLQHDMVEPLFIDEPLDYVYHLASPASPIDYLRLPLHTLKVGSYGTHHALGLAKMHRAAFLVASTSEVYGDPQVHPQPETYWGHVNPIGPRGVYDEAKRYAEALTMAYHRQQGVDTHIVRIFNSVLADEQVLYDDGRELRRETVGELAVRLAPKAVAAGYTPWRTPRGAALLEAGFSPALAYPLTDVRVPAFTAGGRMTAAVATDLVAHPPTDRCVEIRTRYGRSVRVTAHHSVFVEGEDGEPVPVPAGELEPGDRIAIARRIDVPERDRAEVSMIEAWQYAENDPWDLSVEAPGLGQLAWDRRFDLFGLLVSERRNPGANWRNGAWTKLIRMRRTDRVPLPVLRRMGVPLPEGARVRSRGSSPPIPARIPVTDDLLWLLGLWVAEGTTYEKVPKSAVMALSTEDHLLDRAEEVIRRAFGLHVVRAPAAPGRAPALFVHSGLLLRLFDLLGFDHNRKRVPGWILGLPLRRLKWFIEGYREGDGVHSGKTFDAARRHEFSTVSEELKDDLIVAFARFGLVSSVGRYETTFRQRTGDRRYPFWRLTLSAVTPWSPLAWDSGVRQLLNARVHGDLVWAPVSDVADVDPTDVVYDFAVPGLQNFWAGTGVVCHNTYGSRMRPNDGRAIPTFLRQATSGQPLTVFGDGSQTRSFCYVDDLIEGLVRLCNSAAHEPVNIGNPEEYTLLQLAEAILEVTGSTSEIVFEALPIDDPKVRRPDITRAREILGWEPTIGLDEGLRRTVSTLNPRV
jgi:nucleoside-diphosphate-sugar epimerase/intein/homing endonuclease